MLHRVVDEFGALAPAVDPVVPVIEGEPDEPVSDDPDGLALVPVPLVLPEDEEPVL